MYSLPSRSGPAIRPQRNSARLCILHGLFSSGIAGSERYCLDLANRQAELGHEVHVAGRRNSPLARLLDGRVHFHPLGRLFLPWQLRRLAGQIDPHICHAHLSAACKAFGGLPAGLTRIATLHVGYKPHQHRKLDGVICVNHAQLRGLEAYSGSVRVIPNWIPAMRREPAADLRRELRIGTDTPVVGSVGRLHASKGPDVLVRAFREAAPADSALVLIGDGPLRADLERLRAGDPRIHLLGHRNDVRSCLEAFDLFVSPSREESFGLAILEAMTAGLPVISTSTDGPAEHLKAQPVTLVPPGDAQSLAGALTGEFRRFSEGARGRLQYDLSSFSPEVRVADIMEFYEGCLVGKRTVRSPQWTPVPATT